MLNSKQHIRIKKLMLSFVFFTTILTTIYVDAFSQISIVQTENAYIFPAIIKRAPSARSESMARTSLSEIGNTPSFFLNPAGLASIKYNSLFITTGNHYYTIDDAKFLNMAAVYKTVNIENIGIGAQFFSKKDFSNKYFSKLAISYSNNDLYGFDYGVNLNLTNNRNAVSSLNLDIGLIFPIELKNTNNGHTQLNIGAGISNFSFKNFDEPLVIENYNNPPGFNLNSSSSKNPIVGTIGFNFNFYQSAAANEENMISENITITGDIFNIPLYDIYGFRLGFEVIAYEMFSFRVGTLRQNNKPFYHDSGSYDSDYKFTPPAKHFFSWSERTIGFGINIPIHKLNSNINGKNLSLDIVSAKQKLPRPDPLSKNKYHYTLFTLNFTHSLNR